MAVLEALSKFNNSNEENISDDIGVNNEPMEDGSPEVYVRPSKEKELDILWKDFKIAKGDRSPIVYLGIGFVSGIVATLIVSACIGMSSGNFHFSKNADVASPVAVTEQTTSTEESNVSDSETVSSEETEVTDSKPKKFGLFGGSKNNEQKVEEASTTAQNKEYEVQNGDTMEKIVRQFYGSFSTEKVNEIMKASNMSDANKLSIGQKLIIPNVAE